MFTCLLMIADWKEQVWTCFKCGQKHTLQAGAVVWRDVDIAKDCRVSRHVVKRALTKLTTFGVIAPTGRPHCHRVYAFVNWEKYQGGAHSVDQGSVVPPLTTRSPYREEAKKSKKKEPNKGRSSKRAKSKSPTPNQPQQTTLDTPTTPCDHLCLRLRSHVTSTSPGEPSVEPVAWSVTLLAWRKAAMKAQRTDGQPDVNRLDWALDCLASETPGQGFCWGPQVLTMDALIKHSSRIIAAAHQDTRARQHEREMEIPFARPGEDLPQ